MMIVHAKKSIDSLFLLVGGDDKRYNQKNFCRGLMIINNEI